MSPTIRSLVIPVSDLDAAKAVYTSLLGTPHTDQPYYVGYNVDGFEVSLAPGERGRRSGGLRRRRGSRRNPRNPARGWCDRAERPAQSRTRGAGVRARRRRRQPDRPARPVTAGEGGAPPYSTLVESRHGHVVRRDDVDVRGPWVCSSGERLVRRMMV